MEWVEVIGCLIAAWAMLTILGGERQRQLNEAIDRAPAPPLPTPAKKPAKH